MKNVLFFSRSGYRFLFANINSHSFNSYHIVLNLDEKKSLEELGGNIVGCFEEEYDSLPISQFDEFSLLSGFYSDRFMYWLSIHERREFLGKLFSFFQRAINQYDINLCIHETISLEIEEVFSIVCRKNNCKEFAFVRSFIDEYIFLKPDPYSTSIPKILLDKAEPSLEQYEIAKKYINSVRKKGHKPKYLKELDLPKAPPPRSLSKIFISTWKEFLMTKLGLKKQPSREERKKRSLFYYNDYKSDDRNFYQKIQDELYVKYQTYDSLKPYSGFKKVFFPLHFEPEATLFYFANNYSEQTEVLQNIAKELPLDTLLVVKEHPFQPGKLLTSKYHNLRKKNPNIIFLPDHIDSHSLIQEVDFVITIVGSVGWEALLNGIPVMVLGNVYFDNHPEVMKISSYKQIKDHLKRGLTIPGNTEESISYIAKILYYSRKAIYTRDTCLFEENYKNWVDIIVELLESPSLSKLAQLSLEENKA